MKVAIVSSCLYSVPPRGKRYFGYENGFSGGYGGESQVHTLVRALCRAGVNVELFAIAGSIPPERGRIHYLPSGHWRNIWALEPQIIDDYWNELIQCDVVHDWTLTKVIHNHAYVRLNKRCVMTPWGTGAPPPFAQYNTVCWSEFQRQLFLDQGYPETTKWIHGAVEPAMFTPSYSEGEFFLYLSRVHPTKHPEVAIKMARELKFDLVIAADTESPDHIAFLQAAQKACQKDKNIRFVIDPSFEEKCNLYRNAKALILASEGECFGLVTIEAMAHGTPVILKNDGAYPEIVKHGIHGFLCKTQDQYNNAAKNVAMIDRKECRKLVEEKFNSDLLAHRYIEVYGQVMSGEVF